MAEQVLNVTGLAARVEDKQLLHGVDLTINKGETHVLMGPNGAGKSTLGYVLMGAPKYTVTGGQILFKGEDVCRATSARLDALHRQGIGFVFQSFHLLPRQSAAENVALPLLYAGVPKKERRARAVRALERVGLGDRVDFKPNQLSGGQCQRVAIARAIVNNPKILLADEPTGALDSQSGAQIMELFQTLNDEGVTVVMITHDIDVANHAKRVLHIRDGQFAEQHIPEKKEAEV